VGRRYQLTLTKAPRKKAKDGLTLPFWRLEGRASGSKSRTAPALKRSETLAQVKER
jgi:hypothetical protein